MVKRNSTVQLLTEIFHGFLQGSILTIILLLLTNYDLLQLVFFQHSHITTQLSTLLQKKLNTDSPNTNFLDELYPKSQKKWEYLLKPDSKQMPGTFKTELSLKTKLHQVIVPKSINPNQPFLNNIKQLPTDFHWYYFSRSKLQPEVVRKLSLFLAKFDEVNYYTSFTMGHLRINGHCDLGTGFILSNNLIKAILKLQPQDHDITTVLKQVGYSNPCRKPVSFGDEQLRMNFNPKKIIKKLDKALILQNHAPYNKLYLGDGATIEQLESVPTGYKCDSGGRERAFNSDSLPNLSENSIKIQDMETALSIVFIIPILNEGEVILREFIQRWDEGVLVASQTDVRRSVTLLLILPKPLKFNLGSLKSELKAYKLKYGRNIIFQWIQTNDLLSFKESTEVALQKLSSTSSSTQAKNPILCSLPSNIHISPEFLTSLSLNVVSTKQAYYPGIYSPKSRKVVYNSDYFCRYKQDSGKLNVYKWRAAEPSLILI